MFEVELKKEDFPYTIETINFSDEKFKSFGELTFVSVLSNLYEEVEKVDEENLRDFIIQKIELMEFNALVEITEYLEKKMDLGMKKEDIKLGEELSYIYNFFLAKNKK